MLEIEEEDKEEAAVVVVDTVDPRLLLDTLFSSSTEVSNLPPLHPQFVGIFNQLRLFLSAVFRIRIQLNPDPDHAKNLNPDPEDLESGSKLFLNTI